MPHASENYVLQKNIYLKSSLISASILTPRPVLPLVVRVPNGSTHDSVKRSKVIFFPPCFTHSKMLRQSEYSCKCFQIQRLRAEEKHNEMFGLMLAIVLLFQKFQLFHQSRNNITCWLKWWIAADYQLIKKVNKIYTYWCPSQQSLDHTHMITPFHLLSPPFSPLPICFDLCWRSVPRDRRTRSCGGPRSHLPSPPPSLRSSPSFSSSCPCQLNVCPHSIAIVLQICKGCKPTSSQIFALMLKGFASAVFTLL